MSITVNVWRGYASTARRRVRCVGCQVDVKGLRRVDAKDM